MRILPPLVGVATIATLAGAPAAAQDRLACLTDSSPEALARRPSPLDSIMLQIEGHDVKICYGRPSARNRTMIGGGHVPYGELWRTGANEPTIIRTTVGLSIAGVEVPAGTYSIYSVPGESEWEIIVNRSYSQWGHEGQYTSEVRAQEVGRGTAPATETAHYVEQFTISAGDAAVIFEWENTRVTIPVNTSS